LPAPDHSLGASEQGDQILTLLSLHRYSPPAKSIIPSEPCPASTSNDRVNPRNCRERLFNDLVNEIGHRNDFPDDANDLTRR
jgi:hypothetical protein